MFGSVLHRDGVRKELVRRQHVAVSDGRIRVHRVLHRLHSHHRHDQRQQIRPHLPWNQGEVWATVLDLQRCRIQTLTNGRFPTLQFPAMCQTCTPSGQGGAVDLSVLITGQPRIFRGEGDRFCKAESGLSEWLSPFRRTSGCTRAPTRSSWPSPSGSSHLCCSSPSYSTWPITREYPRGDPGQTRGRIQRWIHSLKLLVSEQESKHPTWGLSNLSLFFATIDSFCPGIWSQSLVTRGGHNEIHSLKQSCGTRRPWRETQK